MKLKRKKLVDKGSPRWIVTYADMVTLILVFFILLFSMSQVDLVKFQAISESFRNRMIFDYYPSPIEQDFPTENIKIEEDTEGVDGFNNSKANTPNASMKQDLNQDQTTMDQLFEQVQAYLNDNQLNSVIMASKTDEGVVLTLQENVLFETGEADIINSGKPLLKKIGLLLNNIPNYIRVEGHTDNRPISNYRFPSNWELSGARSSSVIRFILQNNPINPARFIAVGYGDTRPVVENTSPENWRKNRRVEIVILDVREKS
ncbi:flagellar motor protein MotS [Aquibacillus salsiterrae]|uniref:Flagellar motor protein MotB n=1 Tax=Aquibacillus salsiterrae TaxID=2950439 RepID=A0A9X3WAN7_9BACI|nr:flagellar motor protein MotS [Aquibacillus salsiterrae]MDC3415787.1 flagellar motor protein MotB [Aquibacillus salsiterrae]